MLDVFKIEMFKSLHRKSSLCVSLTLLDNVKFTSWTVWNKNVLKSANLNAEKIDLELKWS